MLFTTTSSLEGWTIDEYLGTVATHAVLGTGLLTDFLAGLTDLFGVQSGAYRAKLTELEDYVIEQLTDSARSRRANAVIGVRAEGEVCAKCTSNRFGFRSSELTRDKAREIAAARAKVVAFALQRK